MPSIVYKDASGQRVAEPQQDVIYRMTTPESDSSVTENKGEVRQPVIISQNIVPSFQIANDSITVAMSRLTPKVTTVEVNVPKVTSSPVSEATSKTRFVTKELDDVTYDKILRQLNPNIPEGRLPFRQGPPTCPVPIKFCPLPVGAVLGVE